MKKKLKSDSPLRAATCSPSYWQSWAEWPDGLVYNISGEGKNNTVDRHDTEEQAQGVCSLLEQNGFGGERIHFPVKTWTVPVYPENASLSHGDESER